MIKVNNYNTRLREIIFETYEYINRRFDINYIE